jgi:hypothetical protein
LRAAPFAQVKIAYIDPLSGPFANVGEAGLKGFKEAAEVLVNAEGRHHGPEARGVAFDNKGSPQESLNPAEGRDRPGLPLHHPGQRLGRRALADRRVNKYNERNPGKEVLFFNYAAVDPTLTNEKCSFWHFRFDANSDMKMEAMVNFMKEGPEGRSRRSTSSARTTRTATQVAQVRQGDAGQAAQTSRSWATNCTRSARSRTSRPTSPRSRPRAPTP